MQWVIHVIASRTTELCALGLLVLGACTGNLGDVAVEDAVPGPPDVEPSVVPATPEVLTSTSACTPLRAGEKLLSVSPEGHAWLALPGEASSVRVLDPFGADGMLEETHDLDIGDVQQVLAWSGNDAAVIAGERLWRLADLARLELTPPQGFATPATFCGNPSENGSILSGGRLFEHRADAGEWWGFAPNVPAEGIPTGVVRYDGECQSRDNLMWLTAADGTIFRMEPSEFSRPVRFPKLVDAAATADALYVLESDRLWVGPEEWRAWMFSGAVPTSISASNGHVWMAAGAQLLRFDGTTFVEVAQSLGEPIETVAAHAGGAWIAGDAQICHQAPGTMIRVEGVRPNMRSAESEHQVRIQASDDTTPTATVDGQPITLVEDGGWFEGRVVLGTVGWHEVVLAAGTGSRTVLVKRMPEVERSWEKDVQPIFQASCASNQCHGGGDYTRDLRTIDAWREKATDVRERVVVKKDMPQAGNTPLTPQEIEIISQWIEGGMLP